ncbi:MAG TPA: ABC transporter substrate-binding protein [Reyranella sp.]|nr:ABC transporter substrate-binding protein [Reyranella sp.]
MRFIGRRQALAALALAPLASRIVRAAEPRRLIGCIEEDPPYFNSAASSAISSFVAASPCYSALTRMDLDGKITGDLAKNWEISPDGLTYTFHLHSGVEWHDGRPFTAEDAAFSLGQVNSKLHPYRGAMAAIDKVEAPDKDTVVLRLSHPQVSLIFSLGNFAGAILPKHIWEGKDVARDPHNRQPIGTGPYKFVEYAAGDHILYKKNDKYFLPGKPVFDELMFRIIPDPGSRVAALQKGEVDMIYSSAVPAPEVPRIKRFKNIELRFGRIQTSGYQAYINLRNKPFDDRRVRQALAYAIDRAFIRSTVFPGLSDNMIGPVPPTSPLHNKKLADYPLDPAKANALLDEAGLAKKADGTRFELRFLFAAQDLPAAKISDIMSRNLAVVGIKVVPRPLDRGAWIQASFTNPDFDMTAASFSLGPDPDIGIERFYNSNNIKNLVGANNSAYVNKDLDKLFDEQRVQVDFDKRKAIYDRIQEIVWNDLPVFPFCTYTLPGVFNGGVVRHIFDGEASAREDFVFAELGKKT